MWVAAASTILGLGLASHGAFLWLTRKISHILTGAQRRALFALDDDVKATGGGHIDTQGVKVHREVRSLKNGAKAFCQLITPADRAPSCVLVFFHGYTSHGAMYLEVACILARQGVAVLMPDLPCHGRTDGLLCYVPDWWAFTEQVWEIVGLFLPPALETVGNGRPLKVFAGGVSLGGGLAACMCVQRPTFFEGVVLVAPMLFVSDEVKPPVFVQELMKKIVAPLLPLWPLTPVKSLNGLDFRVPSQGHKFGEANPFSMKNLKARLGTARELGFTFPDWMKTQLKNVRTPLLIAHGEKDMVTDAGLSKELHVQASAADKTLKLYDGAYHCELMSCLPGFASIVGGEWQPEQVAATQQCLGDIAEWLNARA